MSDASDPAGDFQSCGRIGVCIECCDCRTGFRMDITDSIPRLGSFTATSGGTFVVDAVDYSLAGTTDPINLGPVVTATGHVGQQCCEKYIGTITATWTPPTLSEVTETMYVYAGVWIPTGSTYAQHVVSVRLYSPTTDDYVYWFRRIYTGTVLLLDGGDSPLCNIPRETWTVVENEQAADFDGGLIYVGGVTSDTVSLQPAYGNDDGSGIHNGIGTDEANAGDYADPCQCSECLHPIEYKVTLSGLDDLCMLVLRPADATNETPGFILDDTYDAGGGNACFFADGSNATADQVEGEAVSCIEDNDICFQEGDEPAGYTIDAYIDLSLGRTEGAIRVVVTITSVCDGSPYNTATKEVYFDYGCGGISSNPQYVEMFYTTGGPPASAGFITIDCVPA